MADLERWGCPRVEYLPFAYNPEVHFPEPPCTPEEQAHYDCDVVFAGGADRDRIPYIAALTRAGFKVHVYGGYWNRYSETRAIARGHADSRTLRKAIGGARAVLCLVRRANRDGHSMRSFEVAAMRGCMLVEDTEEHREIFGEDGEAVVYFRTIPEMVERLRGLLEDEEERERLRQAAYERVVRGRNTYADRIKKMMEIIECIEAR